MIRLAVAGMAHPHITDVFDELRFRPDVRLVGVAEPDARMRARYAEHTPCPVYTTHHELLAGHEVDVVAVAGVYAERAEVVVDALRAGAHVLADKPLCTSLEQLEAIETAATATGRIISSMFSKRGHPVTIAARRLVEQGLLGDLTLIASTGPHKLLYDQRPSWFFRRDGYGGILGDLPVHDVDLVLALTGAERGTVVGSYGNRSLPQHPTFGDHGALMLVTDAVTATIDAHWLSPAASSSHGRYQMRITGTEGTAELEWSLNRLEVTTHARDTWRPELSAGLRPAEDFFAAVAAGRPPEVGTAESLAAARVALLAQRSADSGGIVESWKI